MFYAKMHDDNDEELPRFEEEEEGLDQPQEGDVVEEIEGTIVEAEPGEEEVETPAEKPAPPKPTPPAKKKAQKAAPKKKATPKKAAKKKAASKKSTKRKKR